MSLPASRPATAAGDDYQQSVDHLEQTPVDLALARSRLVYGEWLRRQWRRGAANRDIATRLFLSAATVDYHLRSVYRKLGASRRVLLARALSDAGLAA